MVAPTAAEPKIPTVIINLSRVVAKRNSAKYETCFMAGFSIFFLELPKSFLLAGASNSLSVSSFSPNIALFSSSFASFLNIADISSATLLVALDVVLFSCTFSMF
ncbi:hypothetical protein AX774_g235 [Zancudomyces culisetae]|uniref:Uncharacterized protein n=1 Tax=Zancudomyces culisetae TaxID=1213189 RepID=A0A1R1PZ09_ZANCU|nr:hypothetical protein AX774_g235 [Zancudomyces culisetae]|eukprot:OMH86208.1 hypothetical protein AX774_g235 [Zancudomyces culisetae]